MPEMNSALTSFKKHLTIKKLKSSHVSEDDNFEKGFLSATFIYAILVWSVIYMFQQGIL